MKKFLSFIVLLVLNTLPQAAANNPNVDTATNFLVNKWQTSIHHAPEADNTRGLTTFHALTSSANVVNVALGSNRGFVVMGPEDAVIGYGLSDTLNFRHLPEPMVEFVKAYGEFLNATSSGPKRAENHYNQDIPSYPSPTIDPVKPFITTKWGQLEPYNRLCPLNQGAKSATGCDAVALAQVLYYLRAKDFNNYTLEYVDKRSQAEISVNYGNSIYDYGKMLNSYAGQKFSEEQADAVAKMMFEAGAACRTEYGQYSSSGNWPLVAMDKYYDFKASYLMREFLPTQWWMRKIQENLQAKLPILYSGGNHIYVLDGIDENNYCHINWGWDGDGDGFYDITFCHPNFQGKDEAGYYNNQLMICDIAKRTPQDTPHVEGYLTTSGTMFYGGKYISEGKACGYTTNSYDRLDKLDTYVVMRKRGEENAKWETIGNLQSYNNINFPAWKPCRFKVNAKGYDGVYDMALAWKNCDSTKFLGTSPLPMAPYVVFQADTVVHEGYAEYEEGITDVSKIKEYLSIEEFEPLTPVIAKAPFYARIKVNDRLDNFSVYGVENAYLRFTDTKTGKQYQTETTIDVYDLNYRGLVSEFVVKIDPPKAISNKFSMPGGRFKLDFYDGYQDTVPSPKITFPKDLYIDVAPEVNYPILQVNMNSNLYSSSDMMVNCNWDHSALAFYAVGYETTNNNYEPVLFNIYIRKDNDPKTDYLLTNFEFTPNINYAETDRGYLYADASFYPFEGTYHALVKYMADGKERDFLPKQWSWRDEATGQPGALAKINIAKVANWTGGPMIEIDNVAHEGTTLSFTATNIGSTQFNGSIEIYAMEPDQGIMKNPNIPNVTMAPNETKKFTLRFDIWQDYGYDLYFKVDTGSEQSRGEHKSSYFNATKPGGEAAKFRVGAPVGINDVMSQQHVPFSISDGQLILSTTCPATLYNPQGMTLYHGTGETMPPLPQGIYIINVEGKSYKIKL